MKKLLLTLLTVVMSVSAWAEDVTATLSGSALTTLATGTSYTDHLTGTGLTDTDGNEWFGRWCYQKSNGNYLQALQFKAPESSYGCRLCIPTFQGNIKTITITSTSNTGISSSDVSKATGNFVVSKNHTSKTYNTPENKVIEGAQSTGTTVLDFTELDGTFTGEGLYIVSTAGVRIWSVVVVYEKTAKVNVASVSLDQTVLNLVKGRSETLTATVLPSNATNKKITWSSDNESVATVVGGVVKGISAGNATITATSQDDGTKSASCAVTVSNPAKTGNVYTKVTGDLTDWTGKYLIVFEPSVGTGYAFNASLSTIDASENYFEIATSDNIEGDEVIDELVFEVAPNNEGYSIKTQNNVYIGIGGTSNGLSTNSNQTTYENVFGYDTENGNSTIKIIKGTDEMKLQFNNDAGQKRFRYYKNGSNGALQLYKLQPKSFDLTIGSSHWASMYLDFAAEVPAGATAYYASSVANDIITLTSINEGEVIPANTGVLVTGTSCTFVESNNAPASVVGNLFNGVTVETPCIANENWVLNTTATAELGDPVLSLYTGTTLGANKAYLPASAVPSGAKTLQLVFGESTGIQSVQQNAQNSVAYNLAGQRVAANAKGIVIVNGKKYLNK